MSDRVYLPSKGSKGGRFHATVCGAHTLEAFDVDDAVGRIRRLRLTACGTCVKYHNLDPTLDGRLAEQEGGR